MHGIVALDRAASARPILELLRANAAVGILIDQDTTAVESDFVDFFGIPALTPVGPARLAVRFGIPVVPLHISRRKDGSHLLVIEEALDPGGTPARTDICASRRGSTGSSRAGSGRTRNSGSGSTSAGAAVLLAVLACAEPGGTYSEESGQVQQLGLFSLTEAGGKSRNWRLECEGGVFHEQDSTMLMWGVRLVMYEDDIPASMLTSDSGEVLEEGASSGPGAMQGWRPPKVAHCPPRTRLVRQPRFLHDGLPRRPGDAGQPRHDLHHRARRDSRPHAGFCGRRRREGELHGRIQRRGTD